MNFKCDPNTNPKHNFPVNQPPCLNFLGCDGRKHVQMTYPKSKLFRTYNGLMCSEWCRLDLTNEQLTMNLYRHYYESHH